MFAYITQCPFQCGEVSFIYFSSPAWFSKNVIMKIYCGCKIVEGTQRENADCQHFLPH